MATIESRIQALELRLKKSQGPYFAIYTYSGSEDPAPAKQVAIERYRAEYGREPTDFIAIHGISPERMSANE